MVSTRSTTTSEDAIIDEDMFHDSISEVEEDPEITLKGFLHRKLTFDVVEHKKVFFFCCVVTTIFVVFEMARFF